MGLLCGVPDSVKSRGNIGDFPLEIDNFRETRGVSQQPDPPAALVSNIKTHVAARSKEQTGHDMAQLQERLYLYNLTMLLDAGLHTAWLCSCIVSKPTVSTLSSICSEYITADSFSYF